MADDYVLKATVIDALISDKVEITDVHRTIGGVRDFEVLNATCDRHADMVMAIPSADVRHVVHARWESTPTKKSRFCSHCYYDEPYKFADEDANIFNFCPNYGADMREVNQDVGQ